MVVDEGGAGHCGVGSFSYLAQGVALLLVGAAHGTDDSCPFGSDGSRRRLMGGGYFSVGHGGLSALPSLASMRNGWRVFLWTVSITSCAGRRLASVTMCCFVDCGIGFPWIRRGRESKKAARLGGRCKTPWIPAVMGARRCGERRALVRPVAGSTAGRT